jgi:hypothetical protein
VARIYEIRQLAAVIKRISDNTRLAEIRALIRTTQKAELLAKTNARNNFTGTKIRPKTGALMNAIFSGYEISKNRKDIVGGVVGVKSRKGRSGTRPYGRIHEYGGTIKPVKAKNLWIPLLGPKSSGLAGRFKNMTPSDFVAAMQASNDPTARFAIIPGRSNPVAIVTLKRQYKSGKVKSKIIAMFSLRKSVEMPERPYIRPAIAEALAGHQERVENELASLDKDHS